MLVYDGLWLAEHRKSIPLVRSRSRRRVWPRDTGSVALSRVNIKKK